MDILNSRYAPTVSAYDVVRLGVATRDAQRAYFKARTPNNLIASKQAEKVFDDAAAALLAKEIA